MSATKTLNTTADDLRIGDWIYGQEIIGLRTVPWEQVHVLEPGEAPRGDMHIADYADGSRFGPVSASYPIRVKRA